MRFSLSRFTSRLLLAGAAFLAALVLAGPIVAILIWAHTIVPLWLTFLIAIIVALMVLIVDEAVDR